MLVYQRVGFTLSANFAKTMGRSASHQLGQAMQQAVELMTGVNPKGS